MEINCNLRREIVPKFWKHFQMSENETGFEKFQTAINQLYRDFSKFETILERTNLLKMICSFPNSVDKRDDCEIFKDMLRSTLISQIPLNFTDVVDSFYLIGFKIFALGIEENQGVDSIEGEKCEGCDNNRDDCRCQELINTFTEINSKLKKMDLLDRIAGHSLKNLVQERITSHIKDTCQGSFDISHLESLEKWLENVILLWLQRIYCQENCALEQDKIDEILKSFQSKYFYFLYETYANTIIDQFFNIIIEYPDSRPAIDDLKFCLEKIDFRSSLIKVIKHSLETRLLHPGVDTQDILTAYVAAIKTIRHLDGSGVLLETVTEPVKEYLRSRVDTVRCVVTSLTEEGPTDLADELAKSENMKNDSSSNEDMNNWKQWNPDPIDANSNKDLKTSRSADIISMVIDIYGSKELFVNEYRNLLGERLLSQMEFNLEKEIRTLELLKLRFGESFLHSCEVMLKDIADSKRINSHIQNDSNYTDGKTMELSALIVSSQFWPVFKKESLELFPDVQEQFDKFTKSYEAHKGNRTLLWNNLHGKVTLDIEFGGKTIEVVVSPTQATIIMHFQKQKEWNLDDLSQIMKIPQSILRKRIFYWQTQGLIKETKEDNFVLNDESMDSGIEQMVIQGQDMCEDDESESAMTSASDQREEELQVFWSYIVGMLTNLDSLPLERIHQMLKMFASQGPGIEFSQQELKNFLQKKVREQQLVFASGVYHLIKECTD